MLCMMCVMQWSYRSALVTPMLMRLVSPGFLLCRTVGSLTRALLLRMVFILAVTFMQDR